MSGAGDETKYLFLIMNHNTYHRLQMMFVHFQKSNILSEVKSHYHEGYSKSCAQILKISLYVLCFYVCI